METQADTGGALELPGDVAAKRSGRVRGRIVRRDALSHEDVQAMWGLFENHYDGVAFEDFARDLAEKEHVILLRDTGDGVTRGFSTLQRLEVEVHGRRERAVFSGDTIVDPAYWGQSAIHRSFLRYIATEFLRRPWKPLYWFLISKGFKTYLLLARNFPNYWPSPGRVTPPHERALLDALAARKFGDAFRPELGVVRHEGRRCRLRPKVAPIDERARNDVAVRFFLEKNPAHADGDELCCLGRIDLEMIWSAVRKFLVRRR